MIGYWRNPVVCLSVRMSVCDAVHSGSLLNERDVKIVADALQKNFSSPK